MGSDDALSLWWTRGAVRLVPWVENNITTLIARKVHTTDGRLAGVSSGGSTPRPSPDLRPRAKPRWR
jgi:hypothetical protein